ncbi:chemotaxis protein CheB [Candidatus Kapabacteria bacterium]|nr:chemotaxis protein CheB [Candidatus Kapabacteria bacterium]
MDKKPRILVVEDEITNTILMKRLLLKAKYDVVIAFNGNEAVKELEKSSFDAVLTDWMMPQMDGIELIKKIRENTKPLPYIIMITALVSDGAKSHALESGADDYIAKPIDINELLTRLQDGLNKRSGKADPNPPKKFEISKNIKPKHVGVAIATSTGGPPALIKFLKAIDPTINATLYVVQHGPPWMLETFSQRLDSEIEFNVQLGAENKYAEKGSVYVAPGDFHLMVDNSKYKLKLDDGPKENFVRPAADVLFRSVAKWYGEFSCGVVLTGLGRDGTAGSEIISEAGGRIFAQNPTDAVAPSMPTSVIGKVDKVVTADLEALAKKLSNHIHSISKKL